VDNIHDLLGLLREAGLPNSVAQITRGTLCVEVESHPRDLFMTGIRGITYRRTNTVELHLNRAFHLQGFGMVDNVYFLRGQGWRIGREPSGVGSLKQMIVSVQLL